jgi:recombination associated protein RdgC
VLKTASYFRIAPDFVIPAINDLEHALQAARFLPCDQTQPESSSWVAPRGAKSLALLETVGGQKILQMCTEKRHLPSSSVKEAM